MNPHGNDIGLTTRAQGAETRLKVWQALATLGPTTSKKVAELSKVASDRTREYLKRMECMKPPEVTSDKSVSPAVWTAASKPPVFVDDRISMADEIIDLLPATRATIAAATAHKLCTSSVYRLVEIMRKDGRIYVGGEQPLSNGQTAPIYCRGYAGAPVEIEVEETDQAVSLSARDEALRNSDAMGKIKRNWFGGAV